MQRIHENLEYKDFDKPSSVTSATVCAKSGLLPIEGVCDSDPRGSQLYNEYFAAGTVPTDTCDHHTKIDICTASYLPAGPNCPIDQIISSVFIVGAGSGSQDSPYSLSADQLAATCNIHNGVITNPDGTTTISPATALPITIPGTNDGAAATDGSTTDIPPEAGATTTQSDTGTETTGGE